VQRIGLAQHTLKLQGAEQGFQGRALVGFTGVKGGLRDRHTQLPRIERDLGDKPRCAIGLPATPAERQSDQQWQRGRPTDGSSPDKTGTSVAAPANL